MTKKCCFDGVLTVALLAALIAGVSPAYAEEMNLKHVVELRNVTKTDLKPLPPNLPIRRHVVGGVPGDGNVAGDTPTGELVYSNTMGAFLFPPGAGVRIADDIRTSCAGSLVTWIEIAVAGGGTGTGPGFTASMELFTACPSSGGVPIPGTFAQFDLIDDGAWHISLDLEDAPVLVPGGFWLAVTVSTNSAGWVMGAPANIGLSEDLFDGPLSCTTFFGGLPNPLANFYAEIYAVECLSVYLAYQANAFSGFFIGLQLNDRFADDILPISAPNLCTVAQYDASLAGLQGPYQMITEIYSNDEASDRPLAPVPGTMRSFNGNGNGFLETASHELAVPAMVPTPLMWMTYDVSGVVAGPILNADFPSIGFSDDCFSIFGNPDAGMFSQCVWFFGGCPQDTAGNPCGTFQNRIFCTGSEPTGACCVAASGNSGCTDNVRVTQCDGRFMVNTSCAPDPFEPACGTAACCLLDQTCENLSEAQCGSASGLWQPGQFCEVGTQSCPNPACIAATQPCDEINFNMGGCNDPNCCTIVCGIDDFCCAVAWDDTCVNLADTFCPLPPPDECNMAVEIACNGSLIVDNTLATTVSSDPGFSCDNMGAGSQGVGSVWAKFTATATTAQISTCNSPTPADDSLVAVYSGTCGALTEIGCSDDVEGCAVTNYNSVVCLSNLTPGQTYYIQLAAWTNADRGQYNIEITCPQSATCGPPEPPVNDNCANAIPITDGTYNFSTIASTTDGPALPAGPQPNGCDEGFGVTIGRDIWYNYTAPGNGMVTVDLCPQTTYDSRIAVYNTCACPAMTANTHECNDDGCPPAAPEVGGASRMEFPVNAGTCYKLRIAGWGANSVGNGAFTVSFSGPGACCRDDGSCTLSLLSACPDGAWTQGDGCSPNLCPQPGACCRDDGSCIESLASLCADGYWDQKGVCTPNTCPQPGACCRDDGSCTVSLLAACPDGAWSEGAVCSPNLCPQPGRCCPGDGSCSFVLQAGCAGEWAEGGSCTPSPCPAQPTVVAVGSRYLRVEPGLSGSTDPLAFHVTSMDYPCLGVYVTAEGLLSALPVFQAPSSWNIVYVGDHETVPSATYHVRALNSGFASAAVVATTWRWGDANNNGLVNLDDILCVLAAFSGNDSGNCTLYGADLIGGFFKPDRTVNLDDILMVLGAFSGAAYPGPNPCP